MNREITLTAEEKQQILQERALAHKEIKQATPNNYSTSQDMMEQVLKQSVQSLIDSTNPDVQKVGIHIAEGLADEYGSWGEIIGDPGLVDRIKAVVAEGVQYDDNLASVADMLDSGFSDMGKDNNTLASEWEATRNSMKVEDVWSRKVSNSDGKTYVVNGDTGEYYTEEDWEAVNTAEVRPDTLGWAGETADGIESESFTSSLEAK